MQKAHFMDDLLIVLAEPALSYVRKDTVVLDRGRRALRVHLGRDVSKDLATLADAIAKA